MKIRKNDMVVVIAGNDRGKTGKVLKIFPKNNRVIIEGINIRKRHTKQVRRIRKAVFLKRKLLLMHLM